MRILTYHDKKTNKKFGCYETELGKRTLIEPTNQIFRINCSLEDAIKIIKKIKKISANFNYLSDDASYYIYITYEDLKKLKKFKFKKISLS